MTTYTLSPSGGPVDACWHRGTLVVVWQDGPGPNAQLVERVIGRGNGLTVSSVTYPLGDDVGAFPRVMSDGSDVWLLYREGRSRGGQAILRKNGIVVWRSPSECGGNDPVCFGIERGGAAFAWQKAGTNEILSGLVGWPSAQLPGGEGRPTGLSHIQANGVVVLVDDARMSVPGMTRPAWAGSLVVGEGSDSGVVVRDTTTGLVAHLWPYEETFTPRVCVDRDLYAVVTWGKPGVRVGYLTTSDLSVPTPTPQPPPIVVPDPPPVVVPPEGVPMSLLDTIEAVRAVYGPTMSDDECVALCNAVAWIHRAEGFGLSRKTSGTRGRRHDGQECCHDVVMLLDGRYWDILTAAGGASTPNWSSTPNGRITDPARGWLAPIAPKDTPVPVPNPPTPTPIPVPTPAPVCQAVDLSPRLNTLSAQVELLRASVAMMDTRVGVVEARLEGLAGRLEAINAEMHEMVVGQVNGLLQAIQSIRR